MIAILFSLATFIGWGVGDVFGTIAARKIGGFSYTFWVYVFAFILTTFYVPFQIVNLHLFTLPILFLCIFLGISLIIGNTFFSEASRISNASLVGVISSSAYSGPAVLLSALFFHESLTTVKIISFFLVLIGVITASINFNELGEGHLQKMIKDRGVVYALIAVFCWTIDAVFLKVAILKVGWFWPMYITILCFPLMFAFMKNQKIKFISPFKKGVFVPVIMATLLLYGGEFTYALGLGSGSPSLVSSISGAYPALFALIAFFVFKDRLTKQQITGILVTLSGVIFLSFFG